MRAGRSGFACALIALLAGCAAATSAGGADDAYPVRGGLGSDLAADVVRVGAFARVQALAISRSRVYIVADDGVAMLDRLTRRWQVPVPLHIATARSNARALAVADPALDVLFVASGSRLWIVRPATRFISTVFLPSDARQLALERNGRGAFVFATGWWLVSPAGSASPLPPGQSPSGNEILAVPDAQQILRETPGLQSFGSLLTRDDQLRTWPLTALARAPERSDVWAGTDGGGVFETDPTMLRSSQHPYGLRTRGASAVVVAADGVWVTEEPDALGGRDFGLTFASGDLAEWRWLSPIRGALGAASMAMRGRIACLATDAGAYMIDVITPSPRPEHHEVPQVGRLIAVWGTPHGCWIGGTTGIARVPWPGDSAVQQAVVDGSRGAYGFASSGDTVWAATQTGLRRYVAGIRTGDGDASAVSGLPNALSLPVRGVALAGAGLAVVTDRGLWLTSGANRTTTAERVATSIDRVGRARKIAADDRTVWLAGSRGVLALSIVDRRSRFIELGDPDTPLGSGGFDDVADLALAPDVAWLATRGGLVRVARGSDGLPR